MNIMENTDKIHKLREILGSRDQTSAIQTPQSLLDEVVRILPGLMDADRCSIFIRDPSQERIWLQSGTGMIERELDLPMRGSISGEVIRSGRSQILNDLKSHIGTHTDVEIMTGYHIRNMLCVPIHNSNGQKVRGVLQVLNKRDNAPFSDNDRQFAETIAEMLKPMVSRLYADQELSSTQALQLHRRFALDSHKAKQLLLLLAALTMSGILALLIIQE